MLLLIKKAPEGAFFVIQYHFLLPGGPILLPRASFSCRGKNPNMASLFNRSSQFFLMFCANASSASGADFKSSGNKFS